MSSHLVLSHDLFPNIFLIPIFYCALHTFQKSNFYVYSSRFIILNTFSLCEKSENYLFSQESTRFFGNKKRRA